MTRSVSDAMSKTRPQSGHVPVARKPAEYVPNVGAVADASKSRAEATPLHVPIVAHVAASAPKCAVTASGAVPASTREPRIVTPKPSRSCETSPKTGDPVVVNETTSDSSPSSAPVATTFAYQVVPHSSPVSEETCSPFAMFAPEAS